MQAPFKFSPSFILPLFQPLIRLSRTCSISSGFNRPPLSSLLGTALRCSLLLTALLCTSSALHCLLRRRRTYAAADSLIFTDQIRVRAEPYLTWSPCARLEASPAITVTFVCRVWSQRNQCSSIQPRVADKGQQPETRPTTVVLTKQEFVLIACKCLYSFITKRDTAVTA
jgi:hypothetical protein